MEKFDAIYQRAAERKGGEEKLESLLSVPLTRQQIGEISDDRWLAAFTMKVFQCGISWQVVRNKWPNFEEHFFNFKLESLLMLSDEHWEQKAKDPKIIKRALDAAGKAFDQWQQASGRSLTEISQVIGFSVGDNRVV